MDDKKNHTRYNSIRGLVQDLSEKFDAMSSEIRQKSIFSDVRPADAKTFMLISRHPRGLTDLANALGISRQATHKSVQRLIEAELVSFEYAEGSRRDKIAQITEKGQQGRALGFIIGKTVDDYVADKIGTEELERLRSNLQKLLTDRS